MKLAIIFACFLFVTVLAEEIDPKQLQCSGEYMKLYCLYYTLIKL